MSNSVNLVFRPVRADDKPRVLDITAHTWDDGDYIHEVFDDWLADPKGQFVAAELDTADAARGGQVVAIGKLTDLGDGELWLEGLRVDPAHRGKGIGDALHHHQLDFARRVGGRVLRYATGQDNRASQRLGARTGFQHVASYRRLTADASLDFAPPEALAFSDWPALQAWLDSPLPQQAHRLYARMWKWSELSETRLRAHLAAGQVFGLKRFDGSGLRAWSICSLIEGWDAAQLHHLAGSDSASSVEMAQAMRGHAADNGFETIETFALEPSPLIDALHAAGYRGEDFTMIVLELRLA